MVIWGRLLSTILLGQGLTAEKYFEFVKTCDTGPIAIVMF
jgi:hypothetical protein